MEKPTTRARIWFCSRGFNTRVNMYRCGKANGHSSPICMSFLGLWCHSESTTRQQTENSYLAKCWSRKVSPPMPPPPPGHTHPPKLAWSNVTPIQGTTQLLHVHMHAHTHTRVHTHTHTHVYTQFYGKFPTKLWLLGNYQQTHTW